MKLKLKYIFYFIICLSSLGIYAEDTRTVLLSQDFSSTTFPPTGWSISASSANWSRSLTSNAGGTSPEARFYYSPTFTGSSYFISPAINTANETEIYLEFAHFLDFYTTPFTIGVATRSSTADTWTTVWSVNPAANIGPQLKSVTLSGSDVGSASFQFAFFFDGFSYNLDFWYIDNIRLFKPNSYDLAVLGYTMPAQVTAGTAISPVCQIKNVGLNTLTAKASLHIYRETNLEVSYPDYYAVSLSYGSQQSVAFPVFTPAVPDEAYKFVFSVTPQETVTDEDLSDNSKECVVNTWTTPRQKVLMEIGTGTWCQFCPGAAMGADDMIANGHSVAIMKNHNNDPFANAYSNARNSYNGVSGFPTTVFDGTLKYVGGNTTTSIYSSYLPLYNQKAAIKSPAELFIYGANSGNDYSITLKVQKNANLLNSNLVLHLVLTESNIAYTWFNQNQVNFVNRLMVPGANGTAINLTGLPNGDYYYNLNFTKDAAWVASNCELVAFIQDNSTKEVLQAQKIALTDLIDLPAQPENVTIQLIGNNIVLNWDAVTQTIHGQAIVPDGYNVYSSETPDGAYQFLAFTPVNSYTHQDVMPSNAKLFYKVKTVKN